MNLVKGSWLLENALQFLCPKFLFNIAFHACDESPNAANPKTCRSSNFREPFGPKHQQSDDPNEGKFPKTNVKHALVLEKIQNETTLPAAASGRPREREDKPLALL